MNEIFSAYAENMIFVYQQTGVSTMFRVTRRRHVRIIGGHHCGAFNAS